MGVFLLSIESKYDALVLVITPIAPEAEDIADFLQREGLNQITTLYGADAVNAHIASGISRPDLVFFGLPLSDKAGRDCFETFKRANCQIVLINNRRDAEPQAEVAELIRPFDSHALSAAFGQVFSPDA